LLFLLELLEQSVVIVAIAVVICIDRFVQLAALALVGLHHCTRDNRATATTRLASAMHGLH